MPSSDLPTPLPPERLYRTADLAALDFATTRELAPLDGLVDQPRAHEAIRFGTDMAVRGFNVFAIGANGANIQRSVRALLEEAAARRQRPSDWVYVNNFTTPYRPVAIALPAGRATELGKAVDRLIDDLKVSLPAAFESEDYQKQRGAIEQEIRTRSEKALCRTAREGDRKGHRDSAHADGLCHDADEGRRGSAARRLQRVVGGATGGDPGLDRGTGEGPRRGAARPRGGWIANCVMRVRKLDQDTARSAHLAAARGVPKAKFADLPKVRTAS